MPFVALQMDLEIILSEVKERQIPFDITDVEYKNYISELIYGTKQSHLHIKQTWLPKGEEAKDELGIWD